MTRILTKGQAEAVYSAMCALNNVGGRAHAIVAELDSGTYTTVYEDMAGYVCVVRVRMYTCDARERYANQLAFAAAYDLEPKS